MHFWLLKYQDFSFRFKTFIQYIGGPGYDISLGPPVLKTSLFGGQTLLQFERKGKKTFSKHFSRAELNRKKANTGQTLRALKKVI